MRSWDLLSSLSCLSTDFMGHLSFHTALAFLYLKTEQTKPNRTNKKPNMLNLLKMTGREILWPVSTSLFFGRKLGGDMSNVTADGVAWPNLSFVLKSDGNSASSVL